MTEIVFDWDQWNMQKNEMKHGVSYLEAQSVFYDPSYKLFIDARHSLQMEKRFILYGKSIENKILMIGFTVRFNRVQVITARPASIKERGVYEEKE